MVSRAATHGHKGATTPSVLWDPVHQVVHHAQIRTEGQKIPGEEGLIDIVFLILVSLYFPH